MPLPFIKWQVRTSTYALVTRHTFCFQSHLPVAVLQGLDQAELRQRAEGLARRDSVEPEGKQDHVRRRLRDALQVRVDV